MAAIPKRALAAEKALEGKSWTIATARSAIEAMHSDFEPIDDFRASADYRRRAAGALLERFFTEHAPGRAGLPTRVEELAAT